MATRHNKRSRFDRLESQLAEYRRENRHLANALETVTDAYGDVTDQTREDALKIRKLKEQVKNLEAQKMKLQKTIDSQLKAGAVDAIGSQKVAKTEEQSLVAKLGYVSVNDIPEYKTLSRATLRAYFVKANHVIDELEKIENMEGPPAKKIKLRQELEQEKKLALEQYVCEQAKDKEKFLCELKRKLKK